MAVVRVNYLPVFLIFIFPRYLPLSATYASQELLSFDCGVADASLQH